MEKQNPKEGSIYSWFDYRSRMFDDNPKRGLRIDHILLSENLEHAMLNTGIDYLPEQWKNHQIIVHLA